MAGQKVACPTCGGQTVLRSLEPPRRKIPVQRLPTASHREEGMAGIAPVSRKILDNVEKVVIGKRQEIVLALVALFSEGHLLLEDVPGVAKTMLARAIAQSVGCSFKRIQCTPDLLPNDITGASVFNPKTTEFEFRRGPLFAHVVLADEINRTTPRTQSALLEAMSERQVTVDGTIYPLQRPFFLIATQNPVDHEGTFSLPEAQLDRFLMRMRLGYPSLQAEGQMMERLQRGHPIDTLAEVVSAAEVFTCQQAIRELHVDPKVREYVLQLVRATREHPAVILGGSPRASLALFHAAQALAAINGFEFVLPDDVKQLAHAVLDHRLIIRPENRLRKMTATSIVDEILNQVEVPLVPEEVGKS
jgi:MoxR-like ATPase